MPAHIPLNQGDIVADAVFEMVNTDGAICAVLTPAIKKKMHELRNGQVLEVRVNDASAPEDIASWCRLTGHELLLVTEPSPHQWHLFIKKQTSSIK